MERWWLGDPLRLALLGTSPAGAGEAGKTPSVRCADTSAAGAGEDAEDLGGGFAGGFGVAVGFGFVFEQVGHAGEGEGFGFGLHEFAAGVRDGFDGALGGLELLGVDDGF